MNPYETLGVPRNAHPDEIKAAWRRCCSKAHPDRVGGSTDRMQAVNEAYGVLSDPVRRERFDLTGDTDEIGTDRMAAEVLRSAFAAAIDQDADPVRFCERHLSESRGNVLKQLAKLDKQIAALKRREGKTKVKSGRNLVDEVIASKLQQAQRERGQASEALAAVEAAAKMFGEYIAEPEPAPAPASWVQYGAAQAETWPQGAPRGYNDDSQTTQSFSDFFRGMK